MNSLLRELVPPHPFRQRVIDPNYYHGNLVRIQRTISEIQNIAPELWDSNLPIATAWVEQVILLQNESLLPVIEDELIVPAQIGVAIAIHEERNGMNVNEKTHYDYHCFMGIYSFGQDLKSSLVISLLIDGAYYLYRTKLAPDALGTSMRQLF